MYRGIINILAVGVGRIFAVAMLIVFTSSYLTAAVAAKPAATQAAAKTVAQTKQAVQKTATAVKPAAAKAQVQAAAKTAPKASAAPAKIVPKVIPSAKSYTERMAELKKAQEKNKKPVAKKPVNRKKIRVQTVDMQIVVWSSKASTATELANKVASKITGSASDYLIKDNTFLADSNSKYICFLRINFKDKLPENWYLESELSAGFGSTRIRAYEDAIEKASMKVENVSDDESAWIGVDCAVKANCDSGVIPYTVTFEKIGSEYYCKMFFRYLKERK